jgi:hypothetical protein
VRTGSPFTLIRAGSSVRRVAAHVKQICGQWLSYLTSDEIFFPPAPSFIGLQ